MTDYKEIFKRVKAASKEVAVLTDSQRNELLHSLARRLDDTHEKIKKANQKDLSHMDKCNPLYDRLQLTDKRLNEISSALRYVASLPSPIGEILEERILPNGIELKKIRVPFGVIGIVYEARPNVTFDVFALCLKSGNASILKGGKDAENTNKVAVELIHQALSSFGLSQDCCVLLPSTHDSTEALLHAEGLVDVCIPRGGKNLIKFVRDTAKIPVIETGAGVVHTFFDRDGDKEIGRKVIQNGKTRRVSVCNALDSLLIHRDRIDDLPWLLIPLSEKKVELYCDSETYKELKGKYPDSLLFHAQDSDCDKEWMDYKMGVYSVGSIEQAILHIDRHGSGHSESIITENETTAQQFIDGVDAACVYVNLPTSFTDGGEFGLGAEIGISTQKLGPRGPMGLREITTYKYVLSGNGQIRR